VASLGDGWADDAPIALVRILETNGLYDALWALVACEPKSERDRIARLFACDCAERALPIFEKERPNDSRPREAIRLARLFAHGEAAQEQLAAERDAARAAAWDAASAAASAAARAAAWDAAMAAARSAARAAARYSASATASATASAAARYSASAAAWDAARSAAWDAAMAAARSAAWDAERALQETHLREMLIVKGLAREAEKQGALEDFLHLVATTATDATPLEVREACARLVKGE